MLGDSLKRRRGGDPSPDRKPVRLRLPDVPWQRWLLLALAVLFGSFGTGYLLATLVFFPRPETAGTGVAVPDLQGLTVPAADTAIQAVGLRLGEVREVRSMAADSGVVMAQDPLPGQQLLPGALVSVGVSAGPPELRVPPVAGLTAATARDLLETVGFDVAEQQTRTGRFAEGLVARTEPPVGTAQRLPAAVTLIVSAGPPLDTLPAIAPDTLPGAPPDTTPRPGTEAGRDPAAPETPAADAAPPAGGEAAP